MEGAKREKPRQISLTNGLIQQNLQVGKLGSNAKSLTLRNIPEPLCYGLVMSRMLKVLAGLSTSAAFTGDPIQDFENLDFKIAKRTQEDPNWKLRETSHHNRRKSSIREEITYSETDGKDELRPQKKQISGDNEAILDFRD